MKFKRLNSNKEVNVNVAKYLIEWDEKSASKFQKSVKDFLKPYWHVYVCLEEFRIPGTRCRADFINLSTKVMIEVNGSQHEKYNQFFHPTRLDYFNQIKRDVQKSEWAKQNGFKYIEIYPSDLPLSRKFFKEQGIEL